MTRVLVLARAASVVGAASFVASVLPEPADAFDCKGATGAVERTICNSPSAKTSDDAMGAAFAVARDRMGATVSPALLADQRDWLKRRNIACDASKNDFACFERENASRTAFLLASPAAGPGTPQPLVPIVVYRKGSARAYEVQIQLFRFAAATSPGETLFNRVVDKMIADAPGEIAKEDRAVGGGSLSWSRTGTIAYASDRLLSVAVGASEYTGGAHPNSSNETINVAMQSGQRLTMDDLLPKDKTPEFVARCSDQIVSQLKDKLAGEDAGPDSKNKDARDQWTMLIGQVRDGVGPATTDLNNWRFGRDSATVSYDPYVVAPYVFGEFSCDVPYGRLRPVAKPTFPLPQ